MAISNCEELREKLNLGGLTGEGLSDRFKELAEALLYDFVIKKGAGKEYRIRTVEFYWYCDDHRDIITYPRNCEAGMWFFHASGVDLTFRSQVKTEGVRQGKRKVEKAVYCSPDPDARFGGILIRCVSIKGEPDGEDSILDGPQLVVNELFDKFNALGEDKVPRLCYCPVDEVGGVTRGNFARMCSDEESPKALRKGLSPFDWNKNGFDQDAWVKEKIRKISSNYSNPPAVQADTSLVKCYTDFIRARYAYTNL